MSHSSLNRLSATAPDFVERLSGFVDEDGYAIVTDVLDSATCRALVQEVDRVERDFEIDFGQNDFEGFKTRRIFNLIARGPAFRELVINETVLTSVEAILGDGFLLSGTTSMHIGPGETAQLLHADDGMISLPRPHPATMVTTLWALTEFTKDNGRRASFPDRTSGRRSSRRPKKKSARPSARRCRPEACS